MFLNQTEKPTWHMDAELRLNRLESETSAVRKRVDAIHESEIMPLHQRRVDLQYRIESITAARNKRVDNTAQLASLNKELDAVNVAFDEAQARHRSAQAEATAAISLLERARSSWRKIGGGMSLGFEMFKA